LRLDPGVAARWWGWGRGGALSAANVESTRARSTYFGRSARLARSSRATASACRRALVGVLYRATQDARTEWSQMTTSAHVELARPRLACLLRAIVRRVQRERIGAERYRNLTAELADYLRAAVVSARTSMQFVDLVARRFEVDLSDDGEGRP